MAGTLAGRYIKIVPHCHSSKPTTIVPLDTGSASASKLNPTSYAPGISMKPWAPFRTRSDFEYTEIAIKGSLRPAEVNAQLAGIHGPWSKAGSTLTIHNHSDMLRSLAAAREYAVPVCLCTYFVEDGDLIMCRSVYKRKCVGLDQRC